MTTICKEIEQCRVCHSYELTDVINLGEQVITSRFPDYGDFTTPKTPIILCLCSTCGLLQLRHNISCNELYEHEYGYRSGISNTMRSHLKQYQEEILATVVDLKENDIIVDIGSNDSTMLQFYDKKYHRVGIDPTGEQFKQYYGDVALIPDYFTKRNFLKFYGPQTCKIVSSISMFYDLPDPVQFAKDIYDILDDDGIWTCEQSYMLTMLERNSFDTICHEHLEYYTLNVIKMIADTAGLKIIRVSFNDCNGGSFRIYFAKKSSQKYQECTELIEEIINREINEIGIYDPKIYRQFMTRCDAEMEKLRYFIDMVNENQQNVYLYGASTKGNCLLQYGQINDCDIECAVERNPQKIGKMTSTNIRIIGEEEMRKNPPKFLLVLPWHFRDEIIEREKDFLDNGGQFIFPLPHFEIYSSKKKVLVTGCDGHIASYFNDMYSNEISYYGIGHFTALANWNTNITKTYIDINNTSDLSECILTIKPDVIVHLSGISSSIRAFHDPVTTLHTNGMVAANICDIIHRNGLKTKFFNSSSSEIYKGHVDYTVIEDDKNMFHSHPYSIAKIMSHSMVDFYRNTYNCPFFNGVIFCSESPRKSDEFLLNKVAKHAKQWKYSSVPLNLGDLNSYRNILHAKDTANAIHHIIRQDTGENFLICNYHSYKILDIVKMIYKENGIDLYQKENILYCSITYDPVVVIAGALKEIDTQVINIQGYPNRLLSIGWVPEYDVELLVKDIVSNYK